MRRPYPPLIAYRPDPRNFPQDYSKILWMSKASNMILVCESFRPFRRFEDKRSSVNCLICLAGRLFAVLDGLEGMKVD